MGEDGSGECAMSSRIPLLKNDRVDCIDLIDRVGGGSAVLGDDKVDRAVRQAQMEDVAE